ncbi:MAG: metallophosphoesterase family protein [Fuscovulum sp.]|jgi:predicted phosphodiesterase|nr:MAG: metallophosphoesterase family protein [Fuscovulum sp.]
MIAIISDIHGNLSALQAVIERIDRIGIRRIVCLGDVAGYYPDLDACADILRNRNVETLMGNHDYYIANGTMCPRSDSANRCLDHQRRTMRSDTLEWLRSLPNRVQSDGLNMVHAGWNDWSDEYMVPSNEYFLTVEGCAFASGHTHVQYLWTGTSAVYCNPGAVGQPRDGDPRAAFATWNGTDFSLFRVPYDIGRTERSMQAAGFPEYFYENLRSGSRIGGKIDKAPL